MRYEPTRKQCAPESAHCSSDYELELLHDSELRYASLHLVEDVGIEGLVL